MKKEFIIYTKGLKVTMHGERLNSSSANSKDITLWQSGRVVARLPKHSLRKFTSPSYYEDEDVILYGYILTI